MKTKTRTTMLDKNTLDMLTAACHDAPNLIDDGAGIPTNGKHRTFNFINIG